MKQWIGFILLGFVAFSARAQYCDFNNCIFWQAESLTVSGDTVNYATNQWSIDEWDNIDCNIPTLQCENLGLEVYYPSTLQPNEKRPLIMLIHGGGFIAGSRGDFRDQAINIAKFGYVTATIDYRLCKRNNCLLLAQNAAFACNLSWGADMAQSAYVAAHDGNAALTFLKQNSETYHIDTNNIIIGGGSAGALTAILMAYTNQAEANTLAGGNNFQSIWGDIGYQPGIKGLISLAGAAFDTTFIDANENIPTFMVHGTCDPLVCYGTDAIYHCTNSYPDAYGGADIALRLAHLNHNYYLYTGQDMGHDVSPLAQTWLIDLLYFLRKNVLCGEPIQKHVVDNLNPDSGECTSLENGILPGSHTRYAPSALPQSNAYGNFPAPCAITMVSEEKTEQEIKLFPNPASNIVSLAIPLQYSNATLRIFNINGKLMYHQKLQSGLQNVSIANFADGLYNVVIEKGLKRFSGKLVVAK